MVSSQRQRVRGTKRNEDSERDSKKYQRNTVRGTVVVVQLNLRPTEPIEVNYEPLLAGQRLTLYHARLEEISPELPKEAAYKA